VDPTGLLFVQITLFLRVQRFRDFLEFIVIYGFEEIHRLRMVGRDGIATTTRIDDTQVVETAFAYNA